MTCPATAADPIVFIVDDDVSIRESVGPLVRVAGWRAETYDSATAFLERPRVEVSSCLVLDVSLPDLNGLEVQQRMVNDQRQMPVIFITGHGDVPTSVRAMKAGAVEFLTKPFSDDDLLSAITGAIEQSRDARGRMAEVREVRERYALLSARERQVMALVVGGLLNKQAASQLRISEITVKAHRGKVMRKMQADSLAALVKMAARLGVGRT